VLAGIVDHALDGIITADEEHRILVYNAAAEAMFGRPAAEIIGQPLERLLPPRYSASHREGVERYGKSSVSARRMGEALRVTGLRANGEEFPLEASISQADIRGQKLFTVIVRDISERERAAELRARLEAQLGEAKKMEAIGTLASGIAHDFNNILGAVLGNTELALHELGGNHPIAGSLEETRQASRRGTELVRQILTFGRQGREPQRVFSLRSVAGDAVKLVRASLPAEIELDTAFGADIPNVLANPTQIHQIVMNLCTNARHAIGDRPGRIDVRLRSTLLEADASHVHADLEPGRYAHLSVSDTGEGIDAVTRERVFEPFFTTKSVGHGTGLGLSVVHGIVKAHGATVTVISRPGEGTTFDLYFSAVEAAVEDGEDGEDAGLALDLQAGGGARVLYIDDEALLVSLGTRLLGRLGYEVSGHTESAEALAAVCADPLAFDLVITDFNMPGLSGLDLARELSQLRPELPVVLMSGYVTDELHARAALYGVRRILQKPSPLEELTNTVRQLTDTTPQP
jgi:PAS domain S-box-containing protein